MTAKITSLLEHHFVAGRAPREEEDTRERSPDAIAKAMRTGAPPPDAAFDRHMPASTRSASGKYWTQLVVAHRAAQWFDELRVGSVVDVGSGAGKFCVAAALAGSSRFTGLEHRPHLVAAARELARTFGVEDRVSFVDDVLGEGPVPAADAYYLYNPFGENLFWKGERLDDEVELSEQRFARDVAAAEQLFESAPIGTLVLTYNGFGGRMPLDYEQARVDRTMPNMLRLWCKTGVLRAPGSSRVTD